MSPTSPPYFSPCHISSESADCRFGTDIPAAEPFLGLTGCGYGDLRCDLDRGRYHHERECLEPECGCKLSVRHVGQPIISSQLGGTSRDDYASLVSGNQSDQIFYTEDADVKLTHRMRRQCFNCKATETSTWRRSLLSAGKMVCVSVDPELYF